MKLKKSLFLLSIFILLVSCKSKNYLTYQPKEPERINILSKTEAKMEYPYDIEVSKDGKNIYFKNWYNYPNANDNNLAYDIPVQHEKILKRKVIYKLNLETKKIDLVKINDDSLIYNDIGDEMEIDEQNNLYINAFKYKGEKGNFIFKISPQGKIINTYDVYENDNNKYPVSMTHPSQFNKFSGPINLVLDNDYIYYAMVMSDSALEDYNFQHINQLNLNNNKTSFVYKRNWKYSTSDNFTIKNAILFSNFFSGKTTESNNIKIVSLDQDWKNIRSINFNNPSNDKKGSNFNDIKINSSLKINSKNQAYYSSSFDVIYKYILDSKQIDIIGNNPYGFKDGYVEEAKFDYALSLSIDKNDNVYVADTGNNAIRKITPDGIVSTIYK